MVCGIATLVYAFTDIHWPFSSGSGVWSGFLVRIQVKSILVQSEPKSYSRTKFTNKHIMAIKREQNVNPPAIKMMSNVQYDFSHLSLFHFIYLFVDLASNVGCSRTFSKSCIKIECILLLQEPIIFINLECIVAFPLLFQAFLTSIFGIQAFKNYDVRNPSATKCMVSMSEFLRWLKEAYCTIANDCSYSRSLYWQIIIFYMFYRL